MTTYWHYTCDHGHAAIGDAGELVPARQLSERCTTWGSQFVWLTDLSVPIRDALGLTRHLVTCDRIAHRYRVTDWSAVAPWVTVARYVPWEEREALEWAPGARPRHWFVSREAVRVVLDERP